MRCALALLATMGCAHHDGDGPPSSVAVESITFDALFVVNGGSHTVSVIDVATGELARTIELVNADFPHHINLSPDRTGLVLAIPGADLSGGHSNGHGGVSGSLLRLDAVTGETLAATRFEHPNHNGVFVANGSEIWTSQMTTMGTVLVLDATTLDLRATLQAGGSPAEVTLSNDGTRAFAANTFSYDVTVYDVATRAVVGTIPVGQAPVGAWPGTDGVMYVDNERTKDLTAIDSTTLEVLRTYSLGFTPAMASIAANGELWVTDVDNGRVVFFSSTSTEMRGELLTARGAHGIAFSDDGATGYISNQDDDSVTIVDVATHTVIKKVAVGSKPNGMVFRAR